MEGGRFPNKLKKYRRIPGYSQKKVARVLALADTSVISRWERGAVLPALHQVFKLSKLYEIATRIIRSDIPVKPVVSGYSFTNFFVITSSFVSIFKQITT